MVKFENIVRKKRLENLLTTFLVKKKHILFWLGQTHGSPTQLIVTFAQESQNGMRGQPQGRSGRGSITAPLSEYTFVHKYHTKYLLCNTMSRCEHPLCPNESSSAKILV